MYFINFPDDYEEHDWEYVDKGAFTNLSVMCDGVSYLLNFYDPTRIAQEIARAFKSPRGYYFRPNLIVVPRVDRATMEATIAELAAAGFASMLPSFPDA